MKIITFALCFVRGTTFCSNSLSNHHHEKEKRANDPNVFGVRTKSASSP